MQELVFPTTFSSNVNMCYTSGMGTEDSLYPWRKPRTKVCKNWLQLNVYGSAIVAAWKQIFVIYGICVGLSLLIVFDIIPENVFPVDQFAFGHIFAIYSFLIGIYYSLAFARNRTALQEYLIQVMGNTVDAGINLSALVKDNTALQKMWRFEYDALKIRTEIKPSTALCHISDMQFILTAMPYAIKHKFRPGEGLKPEKLPMPRSLINELQVGVELGMDGLDRMRDMYVKRVGRMIEANVLPTSSTSNLLAKADNWGTSIGKIDFLLGSAGSMPNVLFNLTLVSLWIYCFYLTFAFYSYWAVGLSLWAYYIVLFMIVAFLLSLFSSITTIDNPFVDPEESNFISIDLGGVANDNARTVDASFELVRAELAAVIENPAYTAVLNANNNNNTTTTTRNT